MGKDLRGGSEGVCKLADSIGCEKGLREVIVLA